MQLLQKWSACPTLVTIQGREPRHKLEQMERFCQLSSVPNGRTGFLVGFSVDEACATSGAAHGSSDCRVISVTVLAGHQRRSCVPRLPRPAKCRARGTHKKRAPPAVDTGSAKGSTEDVQTVAPGMLVRLPDGEPLSSVGDCTLVDRSLYAPRHQLWGQQLAVHLDSTFHGGAPLQDKLFGQEQATSLGSRTGD